MDKVACEGFVRFYLLCFSWLDLCFDVISFWLALLIVLEFRICGYRCHLSGELTDHFMISWLHIISGSR